MLPRLVPEISPLYAFCDVVVGVGVVGVVGVKQEYHTEVDKDLLSK